jgi:citrate lyase subunit beta / citryl-CoA lyase
MTWLPPGPALLFCPASRPDRFEKAALASDMVILDLEDGVALADKITARRALQQTLLDPHRTVVRVNPMGSVEFELDLLALDGTPYELVMLAKTENAEQVDALSPRHVIALCETPAGVLGATSIALCESTVALMWGGEDLIAGLGGHSSRRRDGKYVDVARHARSTILLAAGANRIPAIDTVHIDIDDINGLREEATDAAASGFAATACIHPSQVEVVRDAYRPTDDEIEWSRRVLAAASHSPGVFSFEGRMIDAPILRQASTILRRLSSSD